MTSSEQYTPTPEIARGDYQLLAKHFAGKPESESGAEFDRMIEQVRAGVLPRAR